MKQLSANPTAGSRTKARSALARWPCGGGCALCFVVVFSKFFLSSPLARARAARPVMVVLRVSSRALSSVGRSLARASRRPPPDDDARVTRSDASGAPHARSQQERSCGGVYDRGVGGGRGGCASSSCVLRSRAAGWGGAKGWAALAVCVATFPPSAELEDYLLNFLLSQVVSIMIR